MGIGLDSVRGAGADGGGSVGGLSGRDGVGEEPAGKGKECVTMRWKWILRHPEGQFFERKSCYERSGGRVRRRNARSVARDIAETLSAMANADVREIFGISRIQAFRLLQNLVTLGFLKLDGKGRGARYVSVENASLFS